jgi:hypothetical protein
MASVSQDRHNARRNERARFTGGGTRHRPSQGCTARAHVQARVPPSPPLALPRPSPSLHTTPCSPSPSTLQQPHACL